MNSVQPIHFDNTYSRLPERFYSEETPSAVSEPALIRVNVPLARQLGIDPRWLESPEGVAVMAGNQLPPGTHPIAMAYAGHQFGGWNPQLGDGRAILLGEVVDENGRRFDIQLKGCGQTRYSRMGDGRAPLGPVLREYMVSEGMATLGVPTTRSLGAVTTGEKVYRERVLPGAVLTRVARSHIRVGHFQYFYAREDREALRLLANHVIDRDFPHLADADAPYAQLLGEAVDRQARLIARWQGLGFIHGVMNTDNMLINGETIDYGPCAFMDHYDPGACYSSIDHGKRYAFKNQPTIAHWNISWFAQCLLPILDDNEDRAVEIAQAELNRFPDRFDASYQEVMCRKFGFATPNEDTRQFIEAFLAQLASDREDFTRVFRHLADLADGDNGATPAIDYQLPRSFDTLMEFWHRLRKDNGSDEPLQRVNPVFIPRNHLVEEAIASAEREDDFGHFHKLVDILSSPFDYSPELNKYSLPPEPEEVVHKTFCGT